MLLSNITILPPEKLTELLHGALVKSGNYFVFVHRLANNQLKTVEVYATPIEFSGETLLFSQDSL